MRKFVIFMAVSLLWSCISVNLIKPISKPSYDYSHIEINEKFLPYFQTLDSIYKRNLIAIDYKQIKAVKHIDSIPYSKYRDTTKVYEGLYNKYTKKIYLNPEQFGPFLLGKYNEKMLLILAHETAHSQDLGHSSDTCSIMYPSSKYIMELLDMYTVEELVVAIYNGYPLLEE